MADISEIFINYDNVITTPIPRDWSKLVTVANAAINVPRNDSRNGLTVENDVANAGITSVTDPSGTIFTLAPGGAQTWNRQRGENPINAFVIKHSANAEIVRIKEW